MNWQHYDKYELRYQVLFWSLLALIQASTGAATVFADYHRLDVSIEAWKPIVWESTSQLVGGLLIIAIVWFDKKAPLSSSKPVKSVFGHLLFSIVFSVAHVVGMVALRKLSYSFVGQSYDFGNWPKELLYEYTKDGYSYFWIIVVIYAYRFIISRLRGEAKIIQTGENGLAPEKPKRLLVRKIGKEFIIRKNDIEWIEASGNYMNLHVDGKIYPLRETMTNMEEKLDNRHFVRVHRSSIVNLDYIKEIIPLDTGDFELALNNGQKLRMSRRYRDNVKSLLF